jgi:polyisoprenoid-binding protein YceI
MVCGRQSAAKGLVAIVPVKKSRSSKLRSLNFSALIFALLAFGCANPAANKPKATVGNAAPETSAPNTTGTETLRISPENSKIEFTAAKVTRSHNGLFKQFSGTIDLIAGDILQSRVTVNIDAASVVTDTDDLTAHLKTADFFDVAKFPKATFTSTKIEPASGNNATHTVTGNFELHGIKKSISFPATIVATPADVAVSTEFAINRRDFGLVYPGKADDLNRDGVVIKLTVRVPRKTS